MPYEFTYLKAHGSFCELIDQTLGILEGWIDRDIASLAEARGYSEVYEVLRSISIQDKIALHLPEGVDALGEEFGEQYIWQIIFDIIALRTRLDAADGEFALRAWLKEQGGYDLTQDLINAPEPLRSELILRLMLEGVLIYLDAWFEAMSEVPPKDRV